MAIHVEGGQEVEDSTRNITGRYVWWSEGKGVEEALYMMENSYSSIFFTLLFRKNPNSKNAKSRIPFPATPVSFLPSSTIL